MIYKNLRCENYDCPLRKADANDDLLKLVAKPGDYFYVPVKNDIVKCIVKCIRIGKRSLYMLEGTHNGKAYRGHFCKRTLLTFRKEN